MMPILFMKVGKDKPQHCAGLSRVKAGSSAQDYSFAPLKMAGNAPSLARR
jgi:hypothetical protein